MGNRTTAILLFLVSTMFGFSSWSAKASKCPSPSDLAEIVIKLDYVGVKFNPVGVKCVDANNDNEGSGACSRLGKYKYLNPGNKQYGDLDSKGERDSNGLGYYLCFPSGAGKKEICNDLMLRPERSLYNSAKDRQRKDPNFVVFQWKNHGSDGDCECAHVNGPKNFDQSFRICDQNNIPDIEVVAVIPEENSVICEKNKGSYLGADPDTFREVCNCPNGSKLDFDNPRMCPEKTTADSVAAKATDTPVPSQELKDCVTSQEATINKCVTDSAEAKKQCSKDLAEQSKDYNSKIGVVRLFSNALIQKNAGTGAQAQCAGASLLSSGAAALLKATQDGCDTGLKACYETCKNVEKTFKSVCADKMLATTENSKAAEEKFVAEYDAKYKVTIANAVNLCTVVAKKDSDLLKDGMNAFDGAQRSAAKCACQLSVAGPPPGIANCDSLPTIENCHDTPAIPGCWGAGLLNCQLGSLDFDKDKCQCLREPNLGKCKAPPGKVPFAFAEDARIIAGGGGLGSPVGGSGGGNSDMDLGGYGQKDAVTDDNGPAQGNAPGFAGSGGGGSSGGSGGGGGGGNGDGAAAGTDGEPAEKNLGIMGLVKSAIGGIFGKGGGGGNAAKDPYSAGKPQRPDVNAWKPRGAASIGCKASQVRCKNETIWDIHHEWYVDGQPTLLNGGPN